MYIINPRLLSLNSLFEGQQNENFSSMTVIRHIISSKFMVI